VTQGGQTTTFAYDADGQRVIQDTVTNTIVYVGSHYEKQILLEDLDGNGEINVVDIMQVASRWRCRYGDDCYDFVCDLDDDGDIDIVDIMKVAAAWGETCPDPETVKYYTLGGRRVAMRKKPTGQADTLYYLFGDHLGSTNVVYDTSNDTWTTQRYYPYGSTRSGEVPTDYTFTGQKLDESTGLMYYGARYYDAALGRFVQADTIVPEPGNPQALNRYSYVLNNPLRYVDPTGQAECVDEECNWVIHPVSGRIIQRGPATSPPPPAGYDPAESVQQAWGLVQDWFFETGPTVRYFGPESSLTQDIIYDPGMTRFREAWAAAGYPLPWEWEHSADVREGGLLPIRIAKGGLVYTRENLELARATLGLGSKTPEGQIDTVGGIIGSLDEIRVTRAGGSLVKIEVINTMDWRSGTRVPGTNFFLIPWSLPRSAWGPGGAIVQYFYWWEMMPAR
jgi:RHS repeat-associated protein